MSAAIEARCEPHRLGEPESGLPRAADRPPPCDNAPVTAIVQAKLFPATGLAHRVMLQPDCVIAARAHPDISGDIAQKLVRVEIAAESVEVRLVLAQRRDP